MFYVYTSVSKTLDVLRAIHSCGVNDSKIVEDSYLKLGERTGKAGSGPNLGIVTVSRVGEADVLFLTASTGNERFELNKPADKLKLRSFICWDAFDDFHPSDRSQFPQVPVGEHVWYLDEYLIKVRLGNDFAEIQFFESPQFFSDFPPMSRALALNTELRRRLFVAIMQADPHSKVLFRWRVEGIDEGYKFICADDSRRRTYDSFSFEFEGFEVDRSSWEITPLDKFAEEFDRWTSLSILTQLPPTFQIQRVNDKILLVWYLSRSSTIKTRFTGERNLKRCLRELEADIELYPVLRKELDDFLATSDPGEFNPPVF